MWWTCNSTDWLAVLSLQAQNGSKHCTLERARETFPMDINKNPMSTQRPSKKDWRTLRASWIPYLSWFPPCASFSKRCWWLSCMLWRILNCSVNLMCTDMKPNPPPLELWQRLVNKGLPSRPFATSFMHVGDIWLFWKGVKCRESACKLACSTAWRQPLRQWNNFLPLHQKTPSVKVKAGLLRFKQHEV